MKRGEEEKRSKVGRGAKNYSFFLSFRSDLSVGGTEVPWHIFQARRERLKIFPFLLRDCCNMKASAQGPKKRRKWNCTERISCHAAVKRKKNSDSSIPTKNILPLLSRVFHSSLSLSLSVQQPSATNLNQSFFSLPPPHSLSLFLWHCWFSCPAYIKGNLEVRGGEGKNRRTADGVCLSIHPSFLLAPASTVRSESGSHGKIVFSPSSVPTSPCMFRGGSVCLGLRSRLQFPSLPPFSSKQSFANWHLTFFKNKS